jgi:hypothetical protein
MTWIIIFHHRGVISCVRPQQDATPYPVLTLSGRFVIFCCCIGIELKISKKFSPKLAEKPPSMSEGFWGRRMPDIDGSWGPLHREAYQLAIGRPELSSILLGGTSCLA